MEQTMQKVIPVRGSEVVVDIYGAEEGPAVLVIPGVMADAAAWSPVARALQAWPTVAVLNRRGRHPSGPLTSTYSLELEVEDAISVLRELPEVRTLFGWSFGALIALQVANEQPVPHLIAYEPIMAPFGADALPALRQAHDAGDPDASVEAALREVTGMPPEVIDSLKSDDGIWSELRRLGLPIYSETQAINDAPHPVRLGARAGRIDLIVGERNRGHAPYGTTFDDVAALVPEAAVHVLANQGHLAHLEAPADLALLINGLDRHPR
jgi:pimeloyl-ACP methyl ester carboxylesterase